MTWREGRTATVSAVNRMAHDDSAKGRQTESTQLSRRPGFSRRPPWWAVGLVGLVVLGGGGAVAVSMSAGPSGQKRTQVEEAVPVPGERTVEPSAPKTSADPVEPLVGRFVATGPMVSTGETGTVFRSKVTLRLDCASSCRVVVQRATNGVRGVAVAYAQRVFAPAGRGTYRVRWHEPLSRTSGVLPGCEALTATGHGTLTRSGSGIVISGHSDHDEVPGTGGHKCVLAERDFEFHGRIAKG